MYPPVTGQQRKKGDDMAGYNWSVLEESVRECDPNIPHKLKCSIHF